MGEQDQRWEDWQVNALRGMCLLSNVLSLIGCGFVLYCFLFLGNGRRNYFQKLVFYLSLVNFFNALQWIVSLWTMDISSIVCWTVGPFKLYLYLSSFLWTIFIAIELLIRFTNIKISPFGEIVIPPHSKIKERYYHIIGWFLPVPLMIVPLVQKLMTNGAYSCWYSSPRDPWNWVFIGAVIFTLLVCMLIYVAIFYKYMKILQMKGAYSTDATRESQIERRVPFYILAYVLCWTAPLVTNIVEAIDTTDNSLPMFVGEMITAFLLPLTGWLNSLVYGWNERPLVQQIKGSVVGCALGAWGCCCCCADCLCCKSGGRRTSLSQLFSDSDSDGDHGDEERQKFYTRLGDTTSEGEQHGSVDRLPSYD